MLKINTTKPAGLLAAIKKAIDDGHVATWSYDKDGDFTHTPTQWKNKAYLRPTVATGELHFTIVWPTGSEKPIEVWAVYHGRFIEMLMAHFSTQFTEAKAIP